MEQTRTYPQRADLSFSIVAVLFLTMLVLAWTTSQLQSLVALGAMTGGAISVVVLASALARDANTVTPGRTAIFAGVSLGVLVAYASPSPLVTRGGAIVATLLLGISLVVR